MKELFETVKGILGAVVVALWIAGLGWFVIIAINVIARGY